MSDNAQIYAAIIANRKARKEIEEINNKSRGLLLRNSGWMDNVLALVCSLAFGLGVCLVLALS